MTTPSPGPDVGTGLPAQSGSHYEDSGVHSPSDPASQALPPGAWAGVVAGVAPLAVGLAGLFGAFSLGVGSVTNPGAGLWPAVLSAALALTAVAMLVSGHGLDGAERFSRDMYVQVAGVVSLVVFAVLFEAVGFEVLTLALLAFWLKVIGRESWRMTAIMSAGTCVAVYLIFVIGLSVNLPRILVL